MKKRILTSVLTGTILSTSLFGVTPVLANNFDAQIEEAQREASEHAQAASSLEALMNQLTNEVANTQAALSSLNNEIAQKERFLEETKKELEKAHNEMKQLLEEIAILEENIEKRSEKLEEQARKIQVNGNTSTYFEFILNAESLTDVMARIDIVSNVMKSSNQMIEDQIRDKQAVEEKTVQTERKINQQNALAGELEKTKEDLEAQKAAQEALVVQLQIEQSNVSSERQALLARRNEALQRVSTIEAEREAARVAAQRAQEERERAEAQARAEEERARAEAENVSRPASSNSAAAPSSNNNSSNENGSDNNSSNNGQTSNPPAAKPKPESKPDQKPAPSGSLISIAKKYIGVPYLYGGSTTKAFDCSGYTSYVFRQIGKSLPRSSSGQYANATKVSNPQPGDLVFFSNGKNGRVDHVGIYLGGGQFIGAQTSTGVAIARLDSGYWGERGRVVGYGRY